MKQRQQAQQVSPGFYCALSLSYKAIIQCQHNAFHSFVCCCKDQSKSKTHDDQRCDNDMTQYLAECTFETKYPFKNML